MLELAFLKHLVRYLLLLIGAFACIDISDSFLLEDGKSTARNPPGSDRPSDARKPMHINGPPTGGAGQGQGKPCVPLPPV